MADWVFGDPQSFRGWIDPNNQAMNWPYASYPYQLGMQQASPELIAASHACAAQQSYDNAKHIEEYKRQEWRRTVSQNWLNAMIDVELGI